MEIFPACAANGQMRLVSLNSILMSAVDCKDKDLVNQTFEQLGVTVLYMYHMPGWCKQSLIMKYVTPSSAEGIIRVLSSVKECDVNNYNSKATVNHRNSLRKFLTHLLKGKTLNQTCRNAILKLKIFPSIESSCSGCDFVTADILDCYFLNTTFPIKFPFPVIRVDDKIGKHFLSNLGMRVFDDSDMVRMCLQRSSFYMIQDVRKLMYWLMQSDNKTYLKDTSILNLATNIKFLLNRQEDNCLARELFDPYDRQLSGIFIGDAVFPILPNGSNIQKSLHRLGLKRLDDINQDDIHQAIKTTEQLSQTDIHTAKEKSKNLMSFLNKRPELIPVDKSKALRWICLEFDDRFYPLCIPLQNRVTTESLVAPRQIYNSEQANLVGSVAYLQNCRNVKELAKAYQWNRHPAIKEVVTHLANVVHTFKTHFKTDCLKMITDIYQFLNENYKQHQDTVITDIWARLFDGKKLPSIWNGNGFSAIRNIYIESRTDDVFLYSYMRYLPTEMSNVKELCRFLGCQENLDSDTYLRVLEQIKLECDTCSPTNVNKTVKLVIDILNKISEDDNFNNADESQINRIYIPIETESPEIVQLKCITSCALNDLTGQFGDQAFDEEDRVYIIHSKVPESTAKRLGVRSALQQMLTEGEPFEEFGQNEPLTRRIKVLLKEGYVDGFSVAKELLQNADDAGATEICFLYDERQNKNLRKDLLCKEMSEFQGPALWAYNNATFTEEDLVNITKLNGGTKAYDTTKIGKFGLGFCSVYNVTDLPSFISGNNYVVFDPHATHLKSVFGDQTKSPGLRIDFAKEKNRRVLDRMKHQFQIYDGVFECKLTTDRGHVPFFNGTLFRLPLRTHPSEISDKVYDKREIDDLIKKIIQCAPSMFIFNQHVKQLNIYHQDDSKTLTPRCLYTVQKSSTIIGKPDFHVVEFAAQLKKEKNLQANPLKLLEKVNILIKNGSKQTVKGKKNKQKKKKRYGAENEKTAWLVSWASGTDKETFEIAKREKGVLPLGAVAVPLSTTELEENTEGRLFINCDAFQGQYFYYLPLPIYNKLKFHMHAQFSVTSDRRHLNLRTDDDKESSFTDWNRRLMEDVIVNAFTFLLGKIHTTCTLIYELWPPVGNNVTEKWFQKSFYKYITNEHSDLKVYKGRAGYVSFQRALFLDPKLRKNSDIGDIAFELLTFVLTAEDKCLVDITDICYTELQNANVKAVKSRTITAKEFYIQYFFQNIVKFENHYAEKRNVVTCHILTTQVDKDVLKALKETQCIPTKPNNILRMPRELVDMSGVNFGTSIQKLFPLAGLFNESDERFPIKEFSDYIVLENLRKLGMMHEVLPNDIVIDRAKSIIRLFSTCSECTLNRYRHFMKYLEHALSKDKDSPSLIQQQLQNIPFAVLLNRPKHWVGPWASESNDSCDKHCKKHRKLLQTMQMESVSLAVPCQVFSYASQNLVGCHAKVLSETFTISCFGSKGYKVELFLGIRHVSLSNIDVDSVHLVCEQLEMISKSTNKAEHSIKIVLKDVYTFLDEACKLKGMAEIMYSILTHASVFEKDRFVTSAVIAKSLYGQCKPYLYKLEDTMIKDYKNMVNMLEITETFSLSTFVKILTTIYTDKCGAKLTEEEFEVCKSLLVNVSNTISEKSIRVEDKEMVIYAPNVNNKLFPSTELCFNDFDNVKESESMNFISDRLDIRVCKALGVKKKKTVFIDEHSEYIEDFYQDEPLVIRIKRLIDGYPLDTGLFKEL